MIAEEKKQELFSAIASVQDEAAFDKIVVVVKQLLASAEAPIKQTPAGFLQGSVTYLTDEWDAPLADADWTHNTSEW